MGTRHNLPTMDFPVLLDALVHRRDLSPSMAREFAGLIADGGFDPVPVSAALIALQTKGVSTEELVSFAEVFRDRMKQVDIDEPRLIDACGTGGGKASFNISTASAIVAAAAGAKTAKHGNRALTSRFGSADVLEGLGISLTADPAEQMRRCGIAFLFAPAHHPAVKNASEVRKMLGVRTVFNQLGPLLNPMRARLQIIGVFDPMLAMTMAQAADALGNERTWVVHSEDGLDEISPCAPVHVVEAANGTVHEFVLNPGDFGLEDQPESVLRAGETLEEAAALVRTAVSDIDSAQAKAILPNTAAILHLWDSDWTLRECSERACEAIAVGKAKHLLEELATLSR